VHGVGTHSEYVEKLGVERWRDLEPGVAMSGEVNYGEYG
jgi:hypothetical protein